MAYRTSELWFVPRLILLQTTERLLSTLKQNSKSSKSEGALQTPDLAVVEQLNEVATAKLAEIVRRNTSQDVGFQGYDAAEIIAAKELIDRDTATITRWSGGFVDGNAYMQGTRYKTCTEEARCF